MDFVLNIALILTIGTGSLYFIIPNFLFIIGAGMLLYKSGLKWWYCLIPVFREYQLSRCAQREPEGQVYCIINLCIIFVQLIYSILGINHNEWDIIEAVILAILFALYISEMIYSIRIFNGFTKLYGTSKLWLILCAFDSTCFIPMLIWGFSKKYQPKWKVEDLNKQMAHLAKYGSVAELKGGLTVNLKDRYVTEFFQKKYLLKDIHLAIPAGHMVLLLGGSGAGKTTLLNAINGYEKADANVLLNGNNMYSDYDKMIYEVGFVPQQQMMRDKDTVKKTLMDAAKIRLPVDASNKEKVDRINEVMDIFGLLPVQDSLVEKLSGGQKKRLSISIEFLSNPSLFILDEPDSGLDGVMARELFERLRLIADSGKIVIVITHSPDRVIDLFDDVIVLAKDSSRTGRLAFYGSVDDAREFFERDKMEEIVKSVNQTEEGGDGRADEYVLKYAKVSQNE